MDMKHSFSNLRLNQQAFIEDVRPKYIIPTLLKLGVITDKEEKEIKDSLCREDEVRKLIDFVLTKDANQMKNFIKSLREDENGDVPYPWLAEALEKKKKLSVETHKTLVNGNIPFPINNFLERKLLDDIRDDLKNASSKDRWWVTLLGRYGSGKTVLAAEAVRYNEFVEKIFPGGIYWMYFGYFQENQSPEFKLKKLKEQMKTLFVWMKSDVELHHDGTVENLTLCLRKAVAERGKMLLILDSVGSSNVISAFDIRCTVLVTTTQQDVMNPVHSFVTLERVGDLDERETLSLMYKYTIIPPENMDTARKFAKRCGGSPLMATLISLRLADLGTSLKLWKDFDQELEKQGMDTVHPSGDYNRDFENLVRYSLNSIGDKKKYCYDFLVFSKDKPVPSEVLSILWDLGLLEVIKIMNDLHRRCFVDKVKNEESECPSYIAHYLDVLKKDKKDDWLKERHKIFIEKLNISPLGDLDLTLFSNNYIPMELCYHLYKAGEYGLLENVCLNLGYVEQKIHITGDPKDLYKDYHLYKHTFEHPEHVLQFEEFICKNVSSICKKIDIFQLALFEPENSIVYQKAKNHVSSFNSGHYYNWCNKIQSYLHFKCKIWDVTGERKINHAAINSDGSLVVIVMDTIGEIYRFATDQCLMALVGHGKNVTYCAFNSKGDKVCTASEDTTVKIFKVDELITSDSYAKRQMSKDDGLDQNNESFTFRGHGCQVCCCDFSPDDQILISSDKGGTILVWEIAPSNTESIILRKVKMERPLNILSCFSWDGTLFGACSVNSLKAWKTDASREEHTCVLDQKSLESPIIGFCFSKDNISAFIASIDNIYKCKPGGHLQSVLKSGLTKDYYITCCCLSPDGNYLAYGTTSPSIIVVNVQSLNVVACFQGHNMQVDRAKFSKDGKRLLSVSEERYVIHDVSNLTDKPIANFAENLSVRLNEGELLIASSNFFNRIEVRKGYDGTLLATTEKDEESEITACSISYDCKEVVYGNMKGFVKVFNLDDKSVGCFQKHVKRITFILPSKVNPPRFFTCSEDNTIKIWKEREDPLTLKGHRDSVLMCAEFKKGDRILSCSKDGTMKVWNTETGEILVNMDDGHGNADVRFCDISLPDENLLASASSDETVKIWKSLNGELKTEFKERDVNASVKCCRFLEKLQELVTGHDNGKVKIWSMEAKEPKAHLEKHDSVVYNILCHGKRLLTISNDIKLWDYDLLLKNIVLPSSSVGDAPPYVWASDNFNDIVVIINKVLYILRRIP